MSSHHTHAADNASVPAPKYHMIRTALLLLVIAATAATAATAGLVMAQLKALVTVAKCGPK